MVSCDKEDEEIRKHQFPDGFLFGTSTSSYQIEGAYIEDGKGLSNWDVFSHIPGKIKNSENGDIADDHYHRYLEDIDLMHSLGINTYRFSISWARILPRGRFGDINTNGILFYNKIIDNLLLRGIEPFVTIHHHDLPQELEDRYGGWLSPQIQNDFVHFAEICFESFGDRVKNWVTINEPNLFAEMAYTRGTYPPGHCSLPFGNCSVGNSDSEPLIAMHNMLLSHAMAVNLYRKHFKAEQGGSIGITVSCFMYEPLRDDQVGDRQAANRALAFTAGWVLDPLVFYDYPPEMRHILGSQLPSFTPDCTYIACPLGGDHPIRGFLLTLGEKDGIPIGDRTGMPRFFVVPEGMEKIIDYIKMRYHNTPMFVTENGYSSPQNQDVKLNDFLQDFNRIEFHKAYLAALLRAIRKGADVRGYFIWSLMDNFEWTDGYGTRFGLHYVDFQTLERIPKLSAKWLTSFLTNYSHGDKAYSISKIRNKAVIISGLEVT
ncbi:Beta-glucosidase [Quillaja saponaria]|uniref:Beta-glucosidase n=1 Tax=Quillaja saponaria TaxID=32244 RepID=A0AAD7PBE9_QUISA|nr:Beta-glucosidase [Quillaja saponaria]